MRTPSIDRTLAPCAPHAARAPHAAGAPHAARAPHAFAATLVLAALAQLAAGCSIVPDPLPRDPPPLFDMEEPLELALEPDDEARRVALDLGSFTGVHVADARRSLDEMQDEPEGVLVASVVENSPADIAGIAAGDLVLEVDGRTLRWPSEWRELELETAPKTTLGLLLDRAGVELVIELATVPRVRAAERGEIARFREEEHAGVVLRTASEVEARAAGLGPGGGAVIAGLSRASPWRTAGLRFGDLVHTADGERVASPEVVLAAIRRRADEGVLRLGIARDGVEHTIDARLTRREQEVKRASIPLLYSYENDRGLKTTSALLGLYLHERSSAAWRMRVLWLFRFGGGDADRLKEVGS